MSWALAGLLGLAVAFVFITAAPKKENNTVRNVFFRLNEKADETENKTAPEIKSKFDITRNYNGIKIRVYLSKQKKSFLPGKILNFRVRLKGENAGGFTVNRKQILGLTLNKRREFGGENMTYEEVLLMANGNDHKANVYLHPEVRDLVWIFINDYYCVDFSISGGIISCSQELDKFRDLNEADEVIILLTKLAELLCREGDMVSRLEQNFLADTDNKMKERFLESMASLDRKFSADDIIIKHALNSGVPDLMFLGAQMLKEEGKKYLERILNMSDRRTTLKVLKYAAGSGIAEIIPYFEKHRAEIEDEEIKRALIDYYTGCFSRAENKIDIDKINSYIKSQISDDSNTPEFREKCISVLGWTGTYETIAFLDSVKNFTFARYIDKAIARIQSRIGTGDKGWLSMQNARNEEGDLSVSED